ncbi:MAG TPA: protein-export chaperone SecB [Burkholderiaceae bacterium]
MTQNPTPAGGDGAGSAQSASTVFTVQRIYLKDASLEMPNAPAILLEQNPPQVDVQMDIGNEKVADAIYEVVVRVTVTARVQDKVLFLVEAKQAGIFEVRGLPVEQFDPVLGIVCPGIVYPYLRANVADLVSRTGLPAIHLAEINFEALYRQKLERNAPTQSPIIVPPGSGTRQ